MLLCLWHDINTPALRALSASSSTPPRRCFSGSALNLRQHRCRSAEFLAPECRMQRLHTLRKPEYPPLYRWGIPACAFGHSVPL